MNYSFTVEPIERQSWGLGILCIGLIVYFLRSRPVGGSLVIGGIWAAGFIPTRLWAAGALGSLICLALHIYVYAQPQPPNALMWDALLQCAELEFTPHSIRRRHESRAAARQALVQMHDPLDAHVIYAAEEAAYVMHRAYRRQAALSRINNYIVSEHLTDQGVKAAIDELGEIAREEKSEPCQV